MRRSGTADRAVPLLHDKDTHTHKGSRVFFCIIYEMLPLSLVLHLTSSECQEKSCACVCIRRKGCVCVCAFIAELRKKKEDTKKRRRPLPSKHKEEQGRQKAGRYMWQWPRWNKERPDVPEDIHNRNKYEKFYSCRCPCLMCVHSFQDGKAGACGTEGADAALWQKHRRDRIRYCQ